MSYYYLASQYHDDEREVMHTRAMRAVYAAHRLLLLHVPVFSPIGHNHEMASRYGMPTDHAFWLEYDNHMLQPARGLIVLTWEGWETSKGVRWEIGHAGPKPVHYLPYDVVQMGLPHLYFWLRGEGLYQWSPVVREDLGEM